MIPAHKYYNREFMPHEFQLVHNTMLELSQRLKGPRVATVAAMIEYGILLSKVDKAMAILESKR